MKIENNYMPNISQTNPHQSKAGNRNWDLEPEIWKLRSGVWDLESGDPISGIWGLRYGI